MRYPNWSWHEAQAMLNGLQSSGRVGQAPSPAPAPGPARNTDGDPLFIGPTPFARDAARDPNWAPVFYQATIIGAPLNVLDMNRRVIRVIPRGGSFIVWQQSVALPDYKRIAPLHAKWSMTSPRVPFEQQTPEEVFLPDSQLGTRWVKTTERQGSVQLLQGGDRVELRNLSSSNSFADRLRALGFKY